MANPVTAQLRFRLFELWYAHLKGLDKDEQEIQFDKGEDGSYHQQPVLDAWELWAPASGILWRHQNGNLYEIEALSLLEDDPEQELVTYRPLQGGNSWTRRLHGDDGFFSDRDGKPRFSVLLGAWNDPERFLLLDTLDLEPGEDSATPRPDIPTPAGLPGTAWLHYHGQVFDVTEVVLDVMTEQPLVIYRGRQDGLTWSMPYGMFVGNHAKGGPRFTPYTEGQ